MIVTPQIGTIRSQPGNVQPGFVFGGVIVWRGPFPIANLLGGPGFAGGTLASGFPLGQTIAFKANTTVTDDIGAQFSAADPTWWEFH